MLTYITLKSYIIFPIAMQMTVTWTSGYNIDEAVAFVEWGMKGHSQRLSPAGTLTFHRNSMCGMIYFQHHTVVIEYNIYHLSE